MRDSLPKSALSPSYRSEEPPVNSDEAELEFLAKLIGNRAFGSALLARFVAALHLLALQ